MDGSIMHFVFNSNTNTYLIGAGKLNKIYNVEQICKYFTFSHVLQLGEI